VSKTAIVTGISGQDGAYLAENLLERGYTVYGTYRRTSSVNFWRIAELGIEDHANLKLVEYDLTDMGSAIRLIATSEAEEIYNLAAQSFVGVSFNQPITTGVTTGLGAAYLLEAIRTVNPKVKFYQASTSEMFGKVQAVPQNEETPFYPRSPYGVAKLYAHWLTINYRESFDIFGSSGILFNHESPLRGREFVTRKITDTVAKIALGKAELLELGNLDAKRDWGFARDYVEGMRLMLQHDVPDTFVLATNRTETVRRFVELAFQQVGVDIAWSGTGDKEVGHDGKTGRLLVRINADFYRPTEVDLLIGDATKARNDLGWTPKMNLEELVSIMIAADLRRNEIGISF
jgi:GDPmannose 4,6-dehydratase